MYLFFDTETTGLPKNWKAPIEDHENWPRLVQIAWQQYDNSQKQIASHNYIIKPSGFEIPLQASNVHGITTERAIREGYPLRDILNEFSRAINDSKYLIAHNMNFDEKIAGAEFIRENIENNLFNTKKICTMHSSTDFCKIEGPYGYKWPTLSELHTILFNNDFEDAHDAKADVGACVNCFFELKKLGVINF